MLVNIRALIAECEMLMVISSHDLTRVDGGWPSYFYYLIVHFAAGTLNQFSGKAPMLCTRPPPKLHKNNSFMFLATEENLKTDRQYANPIKTVMD